MSTDRLIAIVVMVITIGASAFFAKHFGLPELYAVCGLLTYFLGSLTGKPTQRRIERELQKMPQAEIDQVYARVSGYPPRPQAKPQPVKLENTDA